MQWTSEASGSKEHLLNNARKRRLEPSLFICDDELYYQVQHFNRTIQLLREIKPGVPGFISVSAVSVFPAKHILLLRLCLQNVPQRKRASFGSHPET